MEKVPGNRGILDGLESAVRTGWTGRRDHGGASVDRSGDRVGDCRGDGANRDRTGGLLLTKQSVLCGTAAQASKALPCPVPASSVAVSKRLCRAKPSSGLEPETPSFEAPELQNWPRTLAPNPPEPREPPTARGIRGSGGRVSNPRPRAWEARALPTELPPHDAGKPLLNRCSCYLSLLPGGASHVLVLPVCARDCARNAVSTRNLHADEGAWLILGLLVAAHAVTIHTERESRVCVPEQIHRCSGVRAQSRKQARVRCV